MDTKSNSFSLAYFNAFLNNLYPTLGFSGSIQEYREWLEPFNKATFDLHTLNPTSYVSSISPTSSYDTLIRHYPLGTDLNAVDHNAATGHFISSSHPNQSIQDFSSMGNANAQATMSNFKAPTNVQRGNYVPVEETPPMSSIDVSESISVLLSKFPVPAKLIEFVPESKPMLVFEP